MQSYSLIAPAKINLYLEIIGARPDGYHELAMVLQSIDLADKINLRANGTEQFRIYCQHPQVPLDKTNLAYRAAELMASAFPDVFAKYGGADITIDKNTPVAAGLAGGSSNAAAVLVGLDLMWKLGLTQSELQELGKQLGSDVPFCITGGTALATGRGEQLSPLPDLDNLYVVLAKYRSLAVSTAWAYQSFRQQFGASYVRDAQKLEERQQRVHSGSMVNAITHRDGAKIGKLLYNDLEKVVFPAYPQVADLRATFYQLAANNGSFLGAMMSGSGPTVFALMASQVGARSLAEEIKAAKAGTDLQVWVAKFVPTGIQIAPTLPKN